MAMGSRQNGTGSPFFRIPISSTRSGFPCEEPECHFASIPRDGSLEALKLAREVEREHVRQEHHREPRPLPEVNMNPQPKYVAFGKSIKVDKVP